ncbi:MAG: hypothetical protein R6X15_07130 [Pseudomonadota bacterium]
MTRQADERIYIDGETLFMGTCPPIPSNEPRIAVLGPEEADFDMFDRTDCYRGYIGTWEVRFERLYLVGIEGMYRLVGDKPLFADWFSGVLMIPRGDISSRSLYKTVYDKYQRITVESGCVTGNEIVQGSGGY